MTDERKNQAGESERTSILPQADDLRADRTEELPASTPLNETAQMPAAHADPVPAYRVPTEESAQGREPEVRGDGQAQEGKAPWTKRALVAVAAVALLSVGFGAGMITHASIVGDGQDYYDQGYQDGYFDRGDEEDQEWESDENGGPGQDARQREQLGRRACETRRLARPLTTAWPPAWRGPRRPREPRKRGREPCWVPASSPSRRRRPQPWTPQ